MQKPICFQRNKRGTLLFWQEKTETFVTSRYTDRIENHNPIGISHRTNKSNCRVTNTSIVLDIAYGFLVAGASSINMASVHGKKADRQPGMGTHTSPSLGHIGLGISPILFSLLHTIILVSFDIGGTECPKNYDFFVGTLSQNDFLKNENISFAHLILPSLGSLTFEESRIICKFSLLRHLLALIRTLI